VEGDVALAVQSNLAIIEALNRQVSQYWGLVENQ